MSLPYRGVYPIAPVPFQDNGDVDYDGMKRVLDCMIDQGVDGIRILAKGEIKTKIMLNVTGASASAVEAVEKAGGKITVKAAPAAAE